MNAPSLTDLSTRLAQPEGAALRDELMGRVQALELRLRTHVATGLPRDEFQAWQAAVDAAVAAREVLAAQSLESSSSPTPTMAPTSFTYP